VGFVGEDDVRAAIQSNSKILIGKKTIITPSARDLAHASDIFIVAD
jgi:ethanolamine utilization cobalamin adenosyltransferase